MATEEQEGPTPLPLPSSSQAVKKRRATINEELAELIKTHLPHLSYQQVASHNFDLDLFNNEHVASDVQSKIRDKRRQVLGPSIDVIPNVFDKCIYSLRT